MSEYKYPPPDDRWVRMGKNCYILSRDKMTKQEKIEIIRVKRFKTKKIIKSIMDDIIDNVVNLNKTPKKIVRKCSNCGETGHDKRKCSNQTIETKVIDNKKASNKNALDNEDKIINSINNNEDVLSDNDWEDLKLNRLNTKAKKITKDNNIFHKSEWNDLKVGTKETVGRAKTDIQILDDMKKINISIKSGKGRFTSADCYETNAIFKSVYNDKFHGNLEIKSIIEEIVMLMKNLGKKKTNLQNKIS